MSKNNYLKWPGVLDVIYLCARIPLKNSNKLNHTLWLSFGLHPKRDNRVDVPIPFSHHNTPDLSLPRRCDIHSPERNGTTWMRVYIQKSNGHHDRLLP